MNRSKIEWCDHTWNPITGCLYNCRYCYAKKIAMRFSGDVRLNKMAKQDYTSQIVDGNNIYILQKQMENETGFGLGYPFAFEPTYHKYREKMLDKLKMGNNILVGNMGDMFGDWVPERWIEEVFKICEDRPQHNYLFITKNPNRYRRLNLLRTQNVFFGTSISTEHEMGRYVDLNHDKGDKSQRFVCFEPLLEDVHPEKYEHLFKIVSWIIIGAETGNYNGVSPRFDWIQRIVAAADFQRKPVFMMDSLVDIVGEGNMRRDYPEQLRKKTMSTKVESRLFSDCASCGVHKKKAEMITLLARSKRGEMPKQFGFLCPYCFKELCSNLNLSVPQLENLKVK